MRRKRYALIICLVTLTTMLGAASAGSWLTQVPGKERARQNPYAGDPLAIQAGAKMFQQYCVSCHGKNAEGKGKKPSLQGDRVRGATPGELQWLLKNGSLIVGMPSWSRLPEEQRWQIVAYVKNLGSKSLAEK